MNPPILYVGGSKGGVGKSYMSFALLDYLTERNKKILLLETDTSNPDVFKAHAKEGSEPLECRQLDLDMADGWIELINLADEFSDHVMVINSAARSNSGIEKYGTTLKETLPELDRKLYTFWMINRQRDSLELLRDFRASFGDAGPVNVFRNLYFGASENFERYNNSKIRKQIEETGGGSFDFPDLADRVSDMIYSERRSITQALQELPIGDRAELKRWRAKYFAIFDTLLEENDA
mgnify:FL=1